MRISDWSSDSCSSDLNCATHCWVSACTDRQHRKRAFAGPFFFAPSAFAPFAFMPCAWVPLVPGHHHRDDGPMNKSNNTMMVNCVAYSSAGERPDIAQNGREACRERV